MIPGTATAGQRHPQRQRGGIVSLLLALLVLGLVLYFALRAHGTQKGAGGEVQAVNCEKLGSDLIKRTGGLGEAYASGYQALPESCRGMLPPPGSLSPKVPEAQGQ